MGNFWLKDATEQEGHDGLGAPVQMFSLRGGVVLCPHHTTAHYSPLITKKPEKATYLL